MNEIKKEQVEEEQPEETKDKKERLDEGTTSDEEATVDKAVEESSKENTDNTESENVSETEINKETEATNAEAINNSGSDELNTNNADVRAVATNGRWGTAYWEYDSSTETYKIHDGEIGSGAKTVNEGEDLPPWLRRDSVFASDFTIPREVFISFNDVKIVGGIQFFSRTGNSMVESYAREYIKGIEFADSVDCSQLTSMNSMFYEGTGLEDIKGLSNLDTSHVTDMMDMFNKCESLKLLRISNWTINSEVNGRGMFYGMKSLGIISMTRIRYCRNNFDFLPQTNLGMIGLNTKSTTLQSVNFSAWETDTITDASGLKKLFSNLLYVEALQLEALLKNTTITDLSEFFHGLESVTTLFVNGWDTSNVTSMRSTFENLQMLNRVDMTGWDTSNVTDMSSTFYNCKSLGSLSLYHWNTSKVTTMNRMFSGTTNLYNLSLDNWEFREDVDLYAFINSKNLQSLSMNNIKYHPSDLTSLGSRMFSGQTKLKVLNAKGWDLPNVTDLSNMGEKVFYRVPVESLDLSDWKTPKVTDMSNAFTGWNTLTTLSLKNWDLSNITDLSNMGSKIFGKVPVKNLDLSGWKTSKVTDMSNAFNSWGTLTTLSLKDWDTSSVINMSQMFVGVSSLTKLDVTHFDTSKVVRMDAMFSEMSSLTELDVTNFDTSSVIDMSQMFYGMSSLTELDVKNFDTSKVSNMVGMFKNMSILKKLDMSGFNVSKVTKSSEMFENTDQIESLVMNDWKFGDKSSLAFLKESIFQYTKNLKTLEVKGWDVSNVTSLEDLYKSVFNAPTQVTEMDLSGWKTQNVTNMKSMFSGAGNLKSLNLSGWDTSKVTDMANMFSSMKSLTELDITSFDTSNVTNMKSMFSGAGNLKSLNLSGWDTSKVTDMANMFSSMKSLTELDITSFDTSNVTNMKSMFSGAGKLKSLNLSGWDTSNVTTMANMFNGMSSLTELDVTSFDTSKVTSMRGMFSNTNVEELDLSKWNTSSVTDMEEMFTYMYNLKKLDISGWTLPGISNMFEATANIEILKMNHLNLSSAETLSHVKEAIFYYPHNLKTLEAKGWDVSKVTSLDNLYQSVFNAPKQITEMDLSGWKTPNVTTMNNMFAGAENLESINLSGWNTKKVTAMGSVFNGAVSLSNLSLADWTTKDEFVDMSKMFKDVKKLERLTLGDEFRFSTLSALESPVSSKKESTGYWTREDGNSAAYAPKDFMKNFGSGDLTGGVYVAEVNIPYSLSNFKAENTTIGQASIISFDLETNEDLDSNLFTDDVMHFSVTANALPEEIEYESVDVSYVSLTTGKLTPIKSKRYDKENKTIHFDVTETMLGLTNKIRITVNGTAWNNTTNSKENTSFLVDYNTDETGPVENSYLARKITGQTQVNNGQLSFSAVPEKLEFNPTKLIVTQEDMVIDRLVPDWGIQVSDYRGTNALSTTDKTVARQDWELLATMDAFTDSKGETVSSSALGLVYINERGNKEELSEKEAVVLETHTVENETAKENHETNVSWEEEKGLKTVVKNRNALNSNEEYAAQVNYELRVAP
ncbi:BspA family leucine-rich repeat surface protein [Staphylococcus aureus]|nr:BspA family leucine-rich repeat surface protein [Staphylococcus aureus]MDN4125465.1 BspA family leucine-rich repeat surface protein [Staphylococcus aureus]